MAVEASATISFMRPAPIPPREDEAAFRPQPNSVEETGIGFGQILDLCTKTIYYGGPRPVRENSEQKTLALKNVETPPTRPAPVPFEEYGEVVKQQSVRQVRVDAAAVDEALTDLVLTRTTRSLVGPAVNSARSLTLSRDPR